MNILSFPSYIIININRRKYTLQKMSLQETIEFSIVYDSYVSLKTFYVFRTAQKLLNWFERRRLKKVLNEKEKELMTRLKIDKYNKKDIGYIFREVVNNLNKNKEEIKETTKNKEKTNSKEETDAYFIQTIIAYFGLHFGWSKKETLSLYLDEINILMQKNEINLDIEALRGASAQLAPGDFCKSLKNKKAIDDKGIKKVNKDLEKKAEIDRNILKEMQNQRVKGLKYGRR